MRLAIREHHCSDKQALSSFNILLSCVNDKICSCEVALTPVQHLNALIEFRAETDNQLANTCVMPRKMLPMLATESELSTEVFA